MICPTLPYEIRLGITGHRTIPDEPSIARAIRDLLDRIRTTLNRTGSTPLLWIGISPLARGADRLFARAVLQQAGGRLEVVTPFPLVEYRKDFESKEDCAEFEQLLTQAVRIDELQASNRSDRGETNQTRGAIRDAAYSRVGERVVEACEILIAIWDGRRAAGTGGTAEIVQYALQRERVVVWIHAERPHEPPRRIRSVSASGEGSDGLAFIGSEAFPRVAKRLSRGYHEQDAYSRDSSLIAERYGAKVRAVQAQLIAAAEDSGLPSSSLDAILMTIVPQYVRADELALLYQRKHSRVVHGVLSLAAAAVTVVVAQVLFFPDQVWLILFEVAAMLAVLGLWWSGRHEAWHKKWLYARYLAERLRTAVYTTLVNGAPGGTTGDDPLPFYRGPQQWMAQIVDAMSRSIGRTLPPLPFEQLKRFVVRAWLNDQQAFHSRNAAEKARRAHRRHWLGFGLFGTTLIMALLHLLGVGHASETAVLRVFRLDLWITFLAVILPAWAGAVHAITSQLELERVAERSKRMELALGWVAQRAMGARTHDELRGAVKDTAELMLMEAHEWWVLLSFQDVRLHL